MPRKILLNVVGDVWFGDYPACIGHGVASVVRREGQGFIFSPIAEQLRGADITFCNLESVLSDVGLRRWSLASAEMRGAPQCIADLKGAGFNLVNVANNHMMQHGVAAFTDTMERLEAAGIAVAGRDSDVGLSIPATIDVGGVSVTTVGFSLRPEEYYKGRPLYSQRDDEQRVVEEVRALRSAHGGIILCSLHWGLEYMERPNNEQRRLAHSIIDAGANVILGHHPHVLQGWERYGSGLILYSLGNFVFDLWTTEMRRSALVKLTLSVDAAPEMQIVPVWINEHYQPLLADGERAREIRDILSAVNPEELSAVDGETYRNKFRELEREFRFSSYRYFYRNLARYPIGMVTQSLGRTALRRLTGQ